jgi:hypothetical protein
MVTMSVFVPDICVLTISVFSSAICDCHTLLILLSVVAMSVFVFDIRVLTISVFISDICVILSLFVIY